MAGHRDARRFAIAGKTNRTTRPPEIAGRSQASGSGRHEQGRGKGCGRQRVRGNRRGPDKWRRRHIRKHRADLFRLTRLLPGSGNLLLADPMFLEQVASDPIRLRDDKTSILPDVNAADDVPQSALIEFQVTDKTDTYEWQPDHADLPAVRIFDSRSANTHAQKTNNVAYVPFPMALLDRSGRARVTARVDALTDQTPIAIKAPSLNKDIAAGAFLLGPNQVWQNWTCLSRLAMRRRAGCHRSMPISPRTARRPPNNSSPGAPETP